MDKDLLTSKTFNINDEQEINNLTVKLKLFNPENNQLIGENNGKQQQTGRIAALVRFNKKLNER
ncbi:hypothetical protein [Spiroplasma endosymbiont of Cleonymus obscurus]|uniref:hypothetical protein n=1 Tax=Spiroplasma endosymbiont of Cleonymus obscurus TaxID=3066324 RepID=UPI0037DD889B